MKVYGPPSEFIGPADGSPVPDASRMIRRDVGQELAAIGGAFAALERRRFVPFAEIPAHDRSKVISACSAAIEAHCPAEVRAVMAAQIPALAHFDGETVKLLIEIPAHPEMSEPDDVDERYVATVRELVDVDAAIRMLVDPSGPTATIAKRREIHARLEAEKRVRDREASERRERMRRRQSAIEERMRVWNGCQAERALCRLAESLHADPAEAKRLKDPAALVESIARALYAEPSRTAEQPGTVAERVFGFEPLPEVD